MKKTGYMLIALLGMGYMAEARTYGQTGVQTDSVPGRQTAVQADSLAERVVDDVAVSDFRIERNGGYIAVDMMLDLSELDVENNRAVLLTPRLTNGEDSLDLPAVGIYGRRRYFYYVRNGESMLSGENEHTYKAKEKPDDFPYNNVMPYEAWMNGATLSLCRNDYGCCNTLLDTQRGILGKHIEAFFPTLVYVVPEAERVKSRSIEGTAYIDFPVDKTVIYPEFRRNTEELGKIQASIDSVRSDSDVTITSVWLKGYASPESPYSHNRELAVGRTAALKEYISNLYDFNDTLVVTGHEPEDWEGLRRYVEQTDLEHKAEILSLIDSDLMPDAKERKIKVTYPQEYRYLLKNCYPALRRTDYRISYDIRSYIDVEEIKRVLWTRPQKLGLDEFYLVAQEYEPGSDEFSEVFETAVRMYPADETANLNAANAAMRRNDLNSAERYLAKAGQSPEAVYARAALAIRKEDYDTARLFLAEAVALGVKQAEITLDELDNGRRP